MLFPVKGSGKGSLARQNAFRLYSTPDKYHRKKNEPHPKQQRPSGEPRFPSLPGCDEAPKPPSLIGWCWRRPCRKLELSFPLVSNETLSLHSVGGGHVESSNEALLPSQPMRYQLRHNRMPRFHSQSEGMRSTFSTCTWQSKAAASPLPLVEWCQGKSS